MTAASATDTGEGQRKDLACSMARSCEGCGGHGILVCGVCDGMSPPEYIISYHIIISFCSALYFVESYCIMLLYSYIMLCHNYSVIS